jgi:hypothetical protein
MSPKGLNYLGITHKDPYKYGGSGVYWKKHLKAHNIKINEIQTLILFETNNYSELCERGRYYSELYDIVNSDEWANLIPETGENSVLGYKFSDDAKNRMSESRKGKLAGEKNPMFGKLVTNETREKISKANTGKKHTDVTKLKMSDRKIGENNHFYGKTHTEETKLKIAEASSKRTGELSNMYGKKHTDVAKLKMSKKRKGRDNGNYNPTPILQYDINNILIREWKDLIELLESGLSKRQTKEISKACRGIIKTYYGFIWKFKK